jgi:hypothetical protein
MKTILISSALFLSFSVANAQNNFVKGYVLPDKGDTLKGEVRINPKKENEYFAKVFFKDATGVQKNYKPEKTKAYGFDDKRFISMELDGEMKFFQVLVSGPMSLYKSIYESMKMNEVTYQTEYYITSPEEAKPVVVKESKFKKQITELMKDNAEIAAAYSEEKKFDLEKATELIKSYNAWKSGK